MYDLIVIGAGPAGIFASIYAAIDGKKVLLIEKNRNLGQKLLISGSGQCNISHETDITGFLERFGNNGKFLRNSLYSYSVDDLKKFLSSIGIELIKEDNGKLFPKSRKSADIVNALEEKLNSLNVDIRKNEELIKIKKDENFIVITDKLEYNGKSLLIATGGLAYPLTGSTGDGYRFAKQFKHNIINTKPCLTPINVDNYPFSDIAGISFKNIKLLIIRDDKKIKECRGDFLFTHKNISGPLILDNSRYMAKNDYIYINFLGISKDDFNKDFLELTNNNGKLSIKNYIVNKGIPERFAKKILKLYNIEHEKSLATISKKERNMILDGFTAFKFKITSLVGYDKAMATTGGIDLKEINKKTMESKLVKNLYFAGEILDIDGDTGGFNIQAAISMGVCVARSI